MKGSTNNTLDLILANDCANRGDSIQEEDEASSRGNLNNLTVDYISDNNKMMNQLSH